MRNVGRKYEIRKTRDLIRIRLAPRRERPYKHKTTPNEIKDKNAIIIFEKISVRIIEILPNILLHTRTAFKEHFKNK